MALTMGEIRAKVRLENRDDRVLFKAGHIKEKDIRVQEIEALVDTGAVLLLLPQDLVETLGLEKMGRVIVTLANEQKVEMDKAWGLSLTIAGRNMQTDCLVGPPGCESLIGQIVLEELDLIPDPVQRTLIPRPESPFLPTLKLKNVVL